MKGYYKNWYQHYLEEQEQKGKELQRGYYTNFAPPETEVDHQTSEYQQGEVSRMQRYQPYRPMKKKKNKFRLLSALLPMTIIVGFVFLWYQMDAGPVRHLVNEALVLTRIREATADVVSYHTILLDQHAEFSEKVSAIVNGDEDFSFEDLDLLYEEIQATYMRVVEVSEVEHEEAIRLWSYKISNTKQMMDDLISDDDGIVAAHAQFEIEQQELAMMIRSELMMDD